MSNSGSFWKNKCVIVTGASSGIGKALSEELIQRGAKVGLLARTQEKLIQITDNFSFASNRTDWCCADVRDEHSLIDGMKQIEKKLGPCDILIANAGIYRKTDVANFNASQEYDVIATNLIGVINSIAAVLPGMINRKHGHIVAVSSVAGMIGLPSAATYSASKSALITLFQGLRVDLYPYSINATIVAPGFVDTPLITDEERETVKDLVSVELAAIRICIAIEKNRAVDWFPWQTWLFCRLLSLMPSGIYRHLVANMSAMEEVKRKN